jgi:hypothetical protein
LLVDSFLTHNSYLIWSIPAEDVKSEDVLSPSDVEDVSE